MESTMLRQFFSQALMVCLLLFGSTAHAVVGETAVVAVLAGNKVSDIVQDVRETGTALLDQANHTGNALIARAANEANVLSRNLSILLQESLDKTFDDLSEERKILLIEAEKLRQDLKGIGDGAYEIKNTTALDLNALLSKIPFIEDKFFLQAVRGLSYLPQKSEYVIEVYATTLGIQEDVSTKIILEKVADGKNTPIEKIRVDQSQQRFLARIHIPNDELSGFVQDKKLNVVELKMEFNVTRKKGWWIFSKEVVEKIDIPIYLSLFPRLAGVMTIETKVPTYDWKHVGSTERSYSTPNRHCEDDCEKEPTRGGNRIDLSVSGGPAPYKVGYRQLRNLRHDCVGGNCGWSDSFRKAITTYGTKAYATWHTWSTSGTWRLKADVYEYQVTGEKAVPAKSVELYFNKIAELKIPNNATYSLVKIKTFTNDEYEIKLGSPDPNGLVDYQGKSPAGANDNRVSFQVNMPKS